MDGSTTLEHYKAGMLLSGVGDAIGFMWEFDFSGEAIHQAVQKLGGLKNIKVNVSDWPVSDDTVLHLATAEALATGKKGEDLLQEVARHYKMGMNDMDGRAPGSATIKGASQLRPDEEDGYRIPYDRRAGGCGAAMRAMCIGLRYPRLEQLSSLVAVAVETGRMTHPHPTGFLGSVASALFAAYAIQRRPITTWGLGLLEEACPAVMEFVETAGYAVSETKRDWGYFIKKWEWYLDLRGLSSGTGPVVWPDQYGITERDEAYKSFSWSGWGGSSGHDAPMIALDALLGAGSSWEELMNRVAFHGGDSDSTAVIACCCWGLLYGTEGVPECNYADLEYKDRLEKSAEKLYELSHSEIGLSSHHATMENQRVPQDPSFNWTKRFSGQVYRPPPVFNMDSSATLEHYKAGMLLSGVGDATGFKWEFEYSGKAIHQAVQKLGGLKNIKVNLPDWPVSDDTVLHLATAEALATGKEGEALLHEVARNYKNGMTEMDGREPGSTTIKGASQLRPDEEDGYRIPYDRRAGGCGAAMRAMCIGLRYPRPEQLSSLVAVAVETGRMTHPHPTGFLGSVASALFAAYAIQRRPITTWGLGLLEEACPAAMEFVETAGYAVSETKRDWGYFIKKWEWYLDLRGLSSGTGPVVWPDQYGITERDVAYKSFSWSGWGGSSGHDAPMIALDALLGAGSSWEELMNRVAFHGGDSDSTAVIACCCWGLLYGTKGVPECNYAGLEYKIRLDISAEKLYELSHS